MMSGDPSRVSDPPAPSDEVVLSHVGRRFVGEGARSPHAALSDVSLRVKRGELLVLVGPSGCGKSTTLRMVAGLDDPDTGELSIGGRSMRGVAPQDRDVAMVFQGYALYPHMTAREILEFPLKMRKMPAVERRTRVDEAAEMLSITQLLDRRPDQMSGGERQRVAMGRAIVRRPRVFLFDEPLSNLDAGLRSELRLEIGALVRRLGATAMYVTHDHVEAMTLADRIAVMRAGRLLQMGTPRDLYERPTSSFVGTFLGTPKMNVVPARASSGVVHVGPFEIPVPEHVRVPNRLEVGLRPEHIHLAGEGPTAIVVAVEPLGAETHLAVELGELRLRLSAPGFQPLARGAEVKLAIDSEHAHFFDPERDGMRLS
jgi:multiple sugar transport system ATP-binding protein